MTDVHTFAFVILPTIIMIGGVVVAYMSSGRRPLER